MSKVCRTCNLMWRDEDNINFCSNCGNRLEFVNDWQGQNQYYGQEIPKDSIIGSYKKFWKNYFVFDGRCRRADYWQAWLVNMIIMIISLVLGVIPVLGVVITVLSAIYSLATIVPGISLEFRRLHDIGKSGAYILFILIPIVGPIMLILWFAREGERGENKYGRNPKYR